MTCLSVGMCIAVISALNAATSKINDVTRIKVKIKSYIPITIHNKSPMGNDAQLAQVGRGNLVFGV